MLIGASRSLAYVGAQLGELREVDADVAHENGVNGGGQMVLTESLTLTCWPRCVRVAYRTLAAACTSSGKMPPHHNKFRVHKKGFNMGTWNVAMASL
jgi:hypothetical protein